MNPLRKWLTGGPLISDGAWGTEDGLGARRGAYLNLTRPERVEAVTAILCRGGSQVILTNTFRANAIAMEGDLSAVNPAVWRFRNGRRQDGRSSLPPAPTGKMLMVQSRAGERGLRRAGRGTCGGGRGTRPAGGDDERPKRRAWLWRRQKAPAWR